MKALYLTPFALVLSVTVASAQDYVQDQIDSLFAQGYTHFSVRRGVLNSSVEAYSPTGQETTVVLDNSTGEVVSQRVETSDVAAVTNTIQAIEQQHLSEVDHSGDELVTVTTATGEVINIELDDLRTVLPSGSNHSYSTVTTSAGETVYVENDDLQSSIENDHIGTSEDYHSGGYDDDSHEDDSNDDHGSHHEAERDHDDDDDDDD